MLMVLTRMLFLFYIFFTFTWFTSLDLTLGPKLVNVNIFAQNCCDLKLLFLALLLIPSSYKYMGYIIIMSK